MRLLIIFLLFLFNCVAWANSELDKEKKIIEIKKDIAAMTARDQCIRNEYLELKQKGYSDKDLNYFISDILTVDKENIKRIKNIMANWGWPGKTLLGEVMAQNFWLLVQHADAHPEVQKIALNYLQKNLSTKDADPKSYAYLSDRVNVKDHLPQRYGTQGRCVGKHQWQAFTLENSEKVDAYRNEMGLPPLKVYQKIMNEMCY